MIENDAQLAATLDYIAKWADTLEGMRRHEAEQHGGVFPTLAAGPLQEIRTNLEAACAFAHAANHAQAPEEWAEALRVWATSHDPNTPLLSDEAIDRESIYEGRGE